MVSLNAEIYRSEKHYIFYVVVAHIDRMNVVFLIRYLKFLVLQNPAYTKYNINANRHESQRIIAYQFQILLYLANQSYIIYK